MTRRREAHRCSPRSRPWPRCSLAAPAALADNGVGLAGPTTDKTVTFFCFGVIAFFALLLIVLSLIQGRLEKRKETRQLRPRALRLSASPAGSR